MSTATVHASVCCSYPVQSVVKPPRSLPFLPLAPSLHPPRRPAPFHSLHPSACLCCSTPHSTQRDRSLAPPTSSPVCHGAPRHLPRTSRPPPIHAVPVRGLHQEGREGDGLHLEFRRSPCVESFTNG